MKRIPISAAKFIADSCGYDQIIVIGRKVGDVADGAGEHVTTYGVDKEHCRIAAHIGEHLKKNVMGWPNK